VPEATDEGDARDAIVATVRRLERAGLNVNASGNVSVRVEGGILVTASGIDPDEMSADDCVLLDGHGSPIAAEHRVPTSEWRLHVGLYRRRPDVGAIVHTHSPEATAAATLGRPLRSIHYVVARFGGADLACAPYSTYGSAELADDVADTLGDDRMACLMANHGAVAVGPDLATALSLAFDVEWFCGVSRRANLLGTPAVLGADEIERVAEQFAAYGQPDDPA
jgi:L-fuculose-phosphate aldolase